MSLASKRGHKFFLDLPVLKTVPEIWQEYKSLLTPYYNVEFPSDILIDTNGKHIGYGANKDAYMLGTEYVLLTPKHYAIYMGTDVKYHILLLAEYFKKERTFIIPKIYYSLDEPSSYILDFVPCDKDTHTKACRGDSCYHYGQFLRFCILECGIIPRDTESCMYKGKLHVFDFGDCLMIDGDRFIELENIKKMYTGLSYDVAAVLRGLEGS